MSKAPDWAPYAPAQYEKADVNAIKAVAEGVADADQQKRAMSFIINNVCRTYDLSYCPGTDGDRNTAMAEGRRFVGLQLVKFINLKFQNIMEK